MQEKVYIPEVKKSNIILTFIIILVIGLTLYLLLSSRPLYKMIIAFITFLSEFALVYNSLYNAKFIIKDDTFTFERYFYKKKIKEESINIKDISQIVYEKYFVVHGKGRDTYLYRYVIHGKDNQRIEIESSYITDNVKILFQDLKNLNPNIAFINNAM